MALTLTCSLLCNVATADAASAELNDYNGNVWVTFHSHNFNEGSFTGTVHLNGGLKAKLRATVEAYHYATSYDKRQDVNVRNYNTYHEYYGQAVTAGGRTISYPVCSKKYPCRALARVNGKYQGKAESTN